MTFTTGTDITTAITDLINAFIALIPILWLKSRKPVLTRHKVWIAAYVSFMLVSLLGFIMHGIAMPQESIQRLWCVLYPLMSGMLITYVSAVKYELDGGGNFRAFLVPSLLLAVVVSVAASISRFLVPRYSFVVFSIYCAANMIYVIARLIHKIKSDKRYLWYLIAAVVLIVGSVLQAVKIIHFTIIWEFNYDSVYHFMTLLFILIQFKGIRMTEHQ